MRLAIDVRANQLTIDGVPAVGHHRWEAAFLALLFKGRHASPSSACGAAALNAALESVGQTAPLNRKQISRICSTLDSAFEAAGAGSEFRERFGHPVRGRTVGPWWWAAQPDDEIRILDGGLSPQGISLLPSLSSTAAAADTAKLCLAVMRYQALFLDGDLKAAGAGLADSREWSAESAEFAAFRQLRLAEVRMQSRDFEGARKAWRRSRELANRSEAAEPVLGPTIAYFQLRMAYAEAPTARYTRIATALRARGAQLPGTRRPEIDRIARGLAWNLLALCERRWLEDHATHCTGSEAAAHLQGALSHAFAALYVFLTANQYEWVQNVCSNVAYLLQRALFLGLAVAAQDALEWYALAQAWQNRFDLAENNVWEYIFLGDFWLYQPQARGAFAAGSPRIVWMGHRPDTLEFYAHSTKTAKQIGEPRQIAHTALNLANFATEMGLHEEASEATRQLRRVLAAHPDIRAILKSEGYRLP